jgi:hypothetical protein
VPAAHVCDARAALELGVNAVERREPGRREIADVARAEEPLGALEQDGILLRPVRKAFAMRGSARIAAATIWNAPGRKAGLVSSARAIACSGGRV